MKMPEDVRIGVFVCHCGKNIGGVVDVPAVVEYAKTLPNVVYAEDNMYTCSEDGIGSIKDRIKEHRLNRVIVSACTPRTHAPLFQTACQEVGVNKYLFEFVNIRDQCSWVHMKQKEEATEKAKDLVRMAVARATLLEPQEETEMDVLPVGLVIGGGVAGLTAALNLANQGIEVHLVEKQKELGGLLRHHGNIFPTDVRAKDVIDPMVKAIKTHSKITVHTGATVEDVSGYIGNFTVTVKGKEIKAGTIIVATGATPMGADGVQGYGKHPNVVTQLQFEDMLKKGKDLPKNVVMIQCAGSRIPERMYCSRVCCMTAIKNAKHLKSKKKDAKIHVLYRDINASGARHEAYYHNVKGTGVKFVHYDVARPPEMIGDKKVKAVKVYHDTVGKVYELPVDLVVLSTPMIPNMDNETLNKMLKVPLSQDGFFLEAHMKLRPVEFATDGIFVAGSAKWPSTVAEAISQGNAAAAKASAPMRKKKVTAEAITSCVNELICRGCGRCAEACPFGAIVLEEKEGRQVAHVNIAVCKGCGVCAVTCPSSAIAMRNFTNSQIGAMIDALLEEGGR
jgi:heterodisulfide reductase subunit A